MTYKFGPKINAAPMHTLVLTIDELHLVESLLLDHGGHGIALDVLAKVQAEVSRQWHTHKGKEVLNAYKTRKGYK